jgi:hypothetical protein
MVTAQERKILVELGTTYAAYFAIIGAIKMSVDWGSFPQWITAIIALAAGLIALYSIHTQRDIARKRAAVDVFVKTEMDQQMIVAFDSFHKGLEEMGKFESVEEFRDRQRDHYLAIRKYLNVHELIAVGIRKEVLDEEVCYHYWCDTLTNGYQDAKRVIDYLRTRPRNKYTYADFEALNVRWLKRMKTED